MKHMDSCNADVLKRDQCWRKSFYFHKYETLYLYEELHKKPQFETVFQYL